MNKFDCLIYFHHPPQSIRCYDQKLVHSRCQFVDPNVRDWGDNEFAAIIIETPQITCIINKYVKCY